MIPLLKRELRRQLPGAACFLAFGLLCATGLLLLSLAFTVDGQFKGDVAVRGGMALVGIAVVGLGAPVFLALASIAPDRESGASAFLATLPIGRGRALAARWFSVALLAAATVAVVSAVLAPFVGPAVERLHDLREIRWIVTLGAIGTASALAASTVVRQTLGAAGLALLLPFVPSLGLVLGEECAIRYLGGNGFTRSTQSPVPVVTLLLAVGVATALRGDLHRASRRSFVVGGVTLFGGTLLLSGLVAARMAGTDRESAQPTPHGKTLSERLPEPTKSPSANPNGGAR